MRRTRCDAPQFDIFGMEIQRVKQKHLDDEPKPYLSENQYNRHEIAEDRLVMLGKRTWRPGSEMSVYAST